MLSVREDLEQVELAYIATGESQNNIALLENSLSISSQIYRYIHIYTET